MKELGTIALFALAAAALYYAVKAATAKTPEQQSRYLNDEKAVTDLFSFLR
ncbi:hypothetical protein [Alicyclobacillus dauci]|uniref:Uncharacterized protein n=1 Tax=Alicyclobacillus dauci TaxID=1475485 RepID=A0ABY6Z689_9BACL|nr:hypothetical protein [Alicyclobacillus dauci]WAH38385.1 hypothetical protein NZD86_07875 [Alicyclobacillus dauci]